ncbi:hypothetical protein TRAPUB_1986 [Trametes pubescens]|uniref:Uncharacterized protein n=1 Tax=Trametes pubescens TaxID=154538 RepID=A0A1M2VHW0_TRAPU|nr:hypothetical protein TRAPUB_1986 [Trametes pubescens]
MDHTELENLTALRRQESIACTRNQSMLSTSCRGFLSQFNEPGAEPDATVPYFLEMSTQFMNSVNTRDVAAYLVQVERRLLSHG